MDLNEKLVNLGSRLSQIDGVEAAGITGGRELPRPGEGDIDLFIYCSRVPSPEVRAAAFPEATIGIFEGKRWGTGDLILLDGVETFMMYMTTADAEDELRRIISGERIAVEDGRFYPTGRVGMYCGMRPLFDGGFIARMQKLCSVYPEKLAHAIFDNFASGFDDVETFERAVTRGDVLLFHSELEAALDAFLQALFALNRTWFPSRKRSLEYIEGFAKKPEGCGQRLLHIVELGAHAESLRAAYEDMRALENELRALNA